MRGIGSKKEQRPDLEPTRQRSNLSPGNVAYWLNGTRLLALFVIWTLVGAFTAWDWVLSPMAMQCPFPERLAASAFFNGYIWAFLTPACFWLAARANPEQGYRAHRAVLLLAVVLGGTLLITLVEAGVHLRLHPMTLMGEPEGNWGRLWTLTTRWYFREVMTAFVVLAAGLVMDSNWRSRTRVRETLELQAQAGRLQAERAELHIQTVQLQAQKAELNAQLAEERLTALRSQLNPHFLFNTLNAVSALVAKDPQGVRSMIALLSELLRYALRDSKKQEIPLHEELKLLQIYLRILAIRYQGQVQIIVSADPDVQEALVPGLILQPLVENAMKHGIERAGGSGTIEVQVSRRGDELILTVRDTGPGGEIVKTAGEGGIGLQLTRARLAELYGSSQRLELERGSAGGMTAKIVLPYHTPAVARSSPEYAQP